LPIKLLWPVTEKARRNQEQPAVILVDWTSGSVVLISWSKLRCYDCGHSFDKFRLARLLIMIHCPVTNNCESFVGLRSACRWKAISWSEMLTYKISEKTLILRWQN
jgi:hypothetical protein